MSAAYFLGKTGDRAAVGPLVELLDDRSPNVRLHAVQALGTIGDARAKPALAARRAVETDATVLLNLTRVVGELGRGWFG